MKGSNYKIEITGRSGNIEMMVDGRINRMDLLVLFDQLAAHLLSTSLERFLVSEMIKEGGLAKVIGREYGETTKIDLAAVKDMMKKGEQNDSN